MAHLTFYGFIMCEYFLIYKIFPAEPGYLLKTLQKPADQDPHFFSINSIKSKLVAFIIIFKKKIYDLYLIV